MTSVFTESAPRSIALPPLFSKSEMLSVSPDGAWLTSFFNNGPSDNLGVPRMEERGDFMVFASSLLEPSSVQGSWPTLASMPLSSPPLAVLHVYPPRTRLSPSGQKAAPALGPLPPPGHFTARSRGPSIVLLSTDLIYFLHPHPLPATVVLDTRSSHAVPTESVSAAESGNAAPLSWTLNALRCPLGIRSYASLNNPGPMSSPSTYRAERGWLGMVGGSDAVWAAVERDGEINVTRIDIGLDSNNMPYLATTPLPALPHAQPKPFEGSSSPPQTSLEEVAFVPLPDGEGAEGVGLSLIYRDLDLTFGPPPRVRMRFEYVELRRRSVSVVDGFKELGSGAGGEGTASQAQDWAPSAESKTTTVSPEGKSILALTALPDVPPHTLAIALISNNEGLFLSHVNLAPHAENDGSAGGPPRWKALVGEEFSLDPSVGNIDLALIPSQGVTRGEMGLVAVGGGGSRPRLVPSPRLGAPAHPDETIAQIAERCARSVELAVVQGVDWSDAVRAAFALVPRHEAAPLSAAILKQALNLFTKHSRSYVPHLLRLQVAVWAQADDGRRALAAELIRLGEASQILYLCGNEEGGVISFDLDSVWHLVDVFEWSVALLGQVFRDAVAEKASAEWTGAGGAEAEAHGSSRVLYLVHPLLRRIVARLVALCAAFAKFVAQLDRPIRPPESAMMLTRCPQATAVAQTRVADATATEGVDLNQWGEVLASLGKGKRSSTIELTPGSRPSDADLCASLLSLDISPLSSQLGPVLSALPAPSSLFSAPAVQPERDGATFAPLGDFPTAVCDRCGARTVLAISNVMRASPPSPWSAWRKNWNMSCVCGGTWVRVPLEVPSRR